MSIPLEDNFADIIGKAQRGLSLADSDLAARAGVNVADLKNARAGKFDTAVAGKIAPVLGLSTTALLDSGCNAWHPANVELDGLAAFNTPFDGMTVNSYLVWDSAAKQAAAFDTGSDCGEMHDFCARKISRCNASC